jgi:hypothetical protein
MRNLLPRTFLLAAAVLVATALLSSDLSADPAGAATLSRRPAAHASARRVSRPYRFRASRSAFRTPRPFRALVADIGDVWAKLRACESGGRYTTNSGNGFYGAYQFHPRTWRNLGFPGLPHQAPPEMQDEAARQLQARSGWGQWPVCSRRIGARR